MFSKIAIAHDGSVGASKAFVSALDISAQNKAELHMIFVEEMPQMPATIDEVLEEDNAARKAFDRLGGQCRAEAKRRRVNFSVHLLRGHAVPKICEFVQFNGCDLLIVGFMGHSALYNRMIGSTTDRLVEHAPCAVLVIK